MHLPMTLSIELRMLLTLMALQFRVFIWIELTCVFDEGNGTQQVERCSQVDGLGRLTSICEPTAIAVLGTAELRVLVIKTQAERVS